MDYLCSTNNIAMVLKKKFNLNQALREGIQGVKRFPLSILSALFAVVTIILALEPNLEYDQIAKLILTSILGIPLFTAIRVLALRMKWYYNWQEIFCIILGVVFLILYHQLLPEVEDFDSDISVPIRFLGFLFILHLMVSYIPYIGKNKDHDFWEFNKQLFAKWIVGGIYVFIIFLGLSLALLALDELFGINIQERRYAQLFILIIGFVHTPYFYSIFPTDFEFDNNEIVYNKFFINLSKYILIPIIILYFVILYAYGIKIIADWELPRGWVSSLVLSMSIAGILTYLLNYRIPLLDNSRWVKYFNKYFWMAFLPLIFLLGVAIYRRLSDYGVTEARFVVASTTVCLFTITLLFLYFDLTNQKRNIVWIPFILSVFSLFTILGPMNAMRVSTKNQYNRLLDYFEEAGLIEAGKLAFKAQTIETELGEKIGSSLNFLNKRNADHLIEHLLPEDFIKEHQDWDMNQVLEEINLTYDLSTAYSYEWFSDNRQNIRAIDISNYKFMRRILLFNNDSDSVRTEGLILQLRNENSWESIGDFSNFYQEEKRSFTLTNESYYTKTINQAIPLNDTVMFVPNNLRIKQDQEGISIQTLDGWLFHKN